MEWYMGAAAIAAGAAAGALIGAVATPTCDPNSPQAICGTRNGARGGAVIGVLLAGIGGAMVSLSKENRGAGLTAVATSAAVVGGLRLAHHPWGS
jgi:hypothetical protein